jgi:alpha-amylase
MASCKDVDLHRDWNYLQASDHFYYMCTKWFSDGVVHHYFNPYGTPYEAFLNYMNVLSDFLIRVNEYAENTSVKTIKAKTKTPAVSKGITEISKKVVAKKAGKSKVAVAAKPAGRATSLAKKK